MPPLATIGFSELKSRALRGDYGRMLRHGAQSLITGELTFEFSGRRRLSGATRRQVSVFQRYSPAGNADE